MTSPSHGFYLGPDEIQYGLVLMRTMSWGNSWLIRHALTVTNCRAGFDGWRDVIFGVLYDGAKWKPRRMRCGCQWFSPESGQVSDGARLCCTPAMHSGYGRGVVRLFAAG